MIDHWNALILAQASYMPAAGVGAVLLALGLLLGAVVLGLLIAHRVKRLRREHEIGNDMVLAVLAEMRQSLTTTVEGVGQLRGAVGELPTRADRDEANQSAADQAGLEQIRDDWNAIRDELERRAADSELHWQTRAKYGRIDRRNYSALVERMTSDGHLAQKAGDFRAATELWSQHKNGRRTPDPSALILMADLRKRILES